MEVAFRHADIVGAVDARVLARPWFRDNRDGGDARSGSTRFHLQAGDEKGIEFIVGAPCFEQLGVMLFHLQVAREQMFLCENSPPIAGAFAVLADDAVKLGGAETTLCREVFEYVDDSFVHEVNCTLFYNAIMDANTSHMLNELNKRFYEDYAESFSKTRANPWKGWERLEPYVTGAQSILDIACGNMRFERFVEKLGLPSSPALYCVDACPALAEDTGGVEFQLLDIVGLCLSGRSVADGIQAPACDFVASFGFFHHVPGVEARHALLEGMMEKTAPNGKLALSFWQFMKDDRISSKAVESTRRFQASLGIDLDAGDYLLGWQDADDVCRYCHSFTDDEIDELLRPFSSSATLVSRYRSDGKTVPLNTYVVLQKA